MKIRRDPTVYCGVFQDISIEVLGVVKVIPGTYTVYVQQARCTPPELWQATIESSGLEPLCTESNAHALMMKVQLIFGRVQTGFRRGRWTARGWAMDTAAEPVGVRR